MQKKQRSCSVGLVAFFAVAWMVFLAGSVLAADATLAWDPNSEVDLAGYGVYYQKFPPDAQYELFGYVAFDELDDSDNPAFIVSGLDVGSQYQFAVTAYDSAGNESAYSIPVCAEIGSVNSVITCPAASQGDSGGGGGGGGGGGCFISALSGDRVGFWPLWPGFLLLGVLVFFIGRKLGVD